MRVSAILIVAGLTLFAASTGAFAQDMNGNSMGSSTMMHKPMTKKQKMMMMHKQQMIKKQQMMQHNM